MGVALGVGCRRGWCVTRKYDSLTFGIKGKYIRLKESIYEWVVLTNVMTRISFDGIRDTFQKKPATLRVIVKLSTYIY